MPSDPRTYLDEALDGGYANVDNALFCDDNDRVPFRDTKKLLDEDPFALKG